MKEFWDKVQATRVKRGLSMQEVADKLGVSKQAYFRMESNSLKKVSDELIANVARALDVEVEELMDTRNEKMHVLFELYPKPILDWLITEEAKDYVLEAYKSWITSQMSKT